MGTKADPAFSAGARYEREFVRRYLRRCLRATINHGTPAPTAAQVLEWVLTREKRYGKKKGGL